LRFRCVWILILPSKKPYDLIVKYQLSLIHVLGGPIKSCNVCGSKYIATTLSQEWSVGVCVWERGQSLGGGGSGKGVVGRRGERERERESNLRGVINN
jgi:hypothetical protein